MWLCDPHPRPAPRPPSWKPSPWQNGTTTPPNVHYDCVYTYTQVWPGSENIYPYIWERVPSWRPIFPAPGGLIITPVSRLDLATVYCLGLGLNGTYFRGMACDLRRSWRLSASAIEAEEAEAGRSLGNTADPRTHWKRGSFRGPASTIEEIRRKRLMSKG